MNWLKALLGLVCIVLGGAWLGQGLGLLPGSFMSGQLTWAIIGLVLAVVGAWLLWSFVRSRGSIGATRP
jgi:hypothetical protein